MLVMAPRPWKDPKTSVFHLRQRNTRSHLLDRLKDRFVVLPVGDGKISKVKIGQCVQVSLRTKDPAEAKRRHAEAVSAPRDFWSVNETGPIELSHKQTIAFVGKVYRAWVGAIEEEPGEAETGEKPSPPFASKLAFPYRRATVPPHPSPCPLWVSSKSNPRSTLGNSLRQP